MIHSAAAEGPVSLFALGLQIAKFATVTAEFSGLQNL